MARNEETLREMVAEIRAIVTDDHKFLRGNGQPGIAQKLASVETKVEITHRAIEAHKEDHCKNKMTWQWWVILAITILAQIPNFITLLN